MKKIIYILIFFMLVISSPAQTKTKDALLFEIEKYSNPGGSRRLSSSNTFYFYQSGRIDCQKYKRDFQKTTTGKKVKCFQTTATKISELVKLAEDPDFQSAKESYILFSGGYDWGKSFYIDYLGGNKKKTIKLIHSRFGDDGLEQIPDSLEKFLTKLGEIDEGLKVEYELGKK
ncbi:MAG: hypothetical protein AAB336_10000 [Acidobacteriota bacterium]